MRKTLRNGVVFTMSRTRQQWGSQHWVAQQNTLEMPGDKDEVNAREIHKCVGRTQDPDKG
jgi:hypothetical protein